MADSDSSSVYMSESEVQNIISTFRSALTMYTNEIEKLQVKNEALNSDLQGEITKSSGLQEELKSLQLQSQEKVTILEGYQDKINLIDASFSRINEQGKSKSQEFSEFFKTSLSSTEANKEGLISKLSSLIETIRHLEVQNSSLRKSNEELQEDLDRMNTGERICKMCMHCKRDFIPKQNKEGDCIYHSGKLKYYSCKGCGDDAYFNCCNKCMKCSEGCRRGKHIPM